jgi:hypothetical protein
MVVAGWFLGGVGGCMFPTAYEFAPACAVIFFGIVTRKTTNGENTRERWNYVVDKQKKCSATGRAVGGRERRSTAAVSRNAGLARLPGGFLITRSVWIAVALAPLCCLTGLWFVKGIIPRNGRIVISLVSRQQTCFALGIN